MDSLKQHHKERATSSELRQFRYLYWIDQKWKTKVLLKKKPYPKHYAKPNGFAESGGAIFFNKTDLTDKLSDETRT